MQKADTLMPGTILVVDDEKNIVQLARLYLNNEGFRVEAAHDGKQALEKAKTVRPDLIVLDIMMPEMDGLTVCKELRKTSNVPVIILTARGDDIDRIVGLEIGADDYMAKPFNPRELVARVKAVLRRAQGEREVPEVIEVDGLRIDAASREVTLDGQQLTASRQGVRAALRVRRSTRAPCSTASACCAWSGAPTITAIRAPSTSTSPGSARSSATPR